MMLDLPELFAPARIVRGRTAMLCSSLIDLKPATLISAIAHGSPARGPGGLAGGALRAASQLARAKALGPPGLGVGGGNRSPAQLTAICCGSFSRVVSATSGETGSNE